MGGRIKWWVLGESEPEPEGDDGGGGDDGDSGGGDGGDGTESE